MLSKLPLSLFDITLNSTHGDVVVVYGNDHECDLVAVSGTVKLAVTGDQLVVKRLRLWLTGELNIDYPKPVSEMVTDQVQDRFCVLRVEWGNLLNESRGDIQFGNYGGDTHVKYSRVEAMIKRQLAHEAQPPRPLGPVRQVSLSPVGCDGTPFQQALASQYVLKKGNYLIPFKCTLPTLFAETVDGVPYGGIHHKLVCGIERPGILERPIYRSRPVRLVRAIHPHLMHLIDAIDVDNNWPGKISYNVKLQLRGVPIGGRIPIEWVFIPVTKTVDLHMIKAHIVQQSQIHVKPHTLLSQTLEKIVAKQHLNYTRVANGDIPVDYDTQPSDGRGEPFRVTLVFEVPSNIGELNPSCDVARGLIRVRHRLVLQIILKNQEGHLSELRANLPIWVYILPNFPVTGPVFHINEMNKWRPERTRHDDVIFRRRSPLAEAAPTDIDDRRFLPPPVYHKHYEDQPCHDPSILPNEPTISGYFDIPIPTRTGVKTPNEVPTYLEAIGTDAEVLMVDPAPVYEGTVASALPTPPEAHPIRTPSPVAPVAVPAASPKPLAKLIMHNLLKPSQPKR